MNDPFLIYFVILANFNIFPTLQFWYDNNYHPIESIQLRKKLLILVLLFGGNLGFKSLQNESLVCQAHILMYLLICLFYLLLKHKFIDQVMLHKSMSKKSSINLCERCDICYKDYNLNTNKPLIICQSNHSICKVCLIAIREKPLCPFCRQSVSYQQIRLNHSVVHKITKKTLSFNPQADFRNMKVNQTVLKVQDIHEIEHNQHANVYLDESEFRQQEGEQQLHRNTQEPFIKCSIFLISLYIYFVFLQLPLGSINIYTGFNLDKNQCSLAQMTEIYSQLGLSYKTLGGIQLILSLHFLYLRYLYKMKKVSQIGQLLFDIILSFFVILKSTISIVIFIKFLHEKALSLCIPDVYHFMVVNLFVNYFAILIGLNIILRLCCLIQTNR